MPLTVLLANVAYGNLRKPKAFWSKLDEQSDIPPVVKPSFTPRFKLRRGEAVFTIGSCFARAIEESLQLHGYAVPMAEYRPRNEGDGLGLLNKFTPHSMLNELQWALDPSFQDFDQRKALLSGTEGNWVDGQLVSPLELAEDAAMERRR